MKRIIVLALVFMFSSAAFAADFKQVPRRQSLVKNTTLKKGVQINKSVLEFLKSRSCTQEPSCKNPYYTLSSEPCDKYGKPELFPGECFICSVTAALKAEAQCPDGWHPGQIGCHLDSPSFMCWLDDCACPAGPNWKDCAKTNCPNAQDLSKPCPDDFDFVTDYDFTDYYRCVARIPVCNQCGSMAFGGNSSNGDIFCGGMDHQ